MELPRDMTHPSVLARIRHRLSRDEWCLPVAPDADPVSWWVKTWHDPYATGANPDYRDRDGNLAGHTGIDLNKGYGDQDRGETVHAMSAGRVVSTGWSAGWLAVVVIAHRWRGRRLYIRYAHLDRATVKVRPGDWVHWRQEIGAIGNYGPDGTGDHLHLDMCWHDKAKPPLHWREWLTVRSWLNPLVLFYAEFTENTVTDLIR